MSTVTISQLRHRRHEHLRAAEQGERVVVLARDQPIAAIVPYVDDESLKLRRPAAGAPALHEIPLPPPFDLGFDVVDLLLEDRQAGR